MNNEQIVKTIKSRMKDYENQVINKMREELVAEWKKAYPEAVKEKSVYLHPLVKNLGKENKRTPEDPDSVWNNDIYNVTFRWLPTDPVFKTKEGIIQLGISTLDGTARHDWREFQAIKNQLAGPECEAFELYPAESRLLDPSNYYTLWCFPGLKRIRVGMEVLRVFDQNEAMAPQRALPNKMENE